MWPVIDTVFSKFAEDPRVMERTCRCMRFLVRSVSKQCAELLAPLVTKVIFNLIEDISKKNSLADSNGVYFFMVKYSLVHSARRKLRKEQTRVLPLPRLRPR